MASGFVQSVRQNVLSLLYLGTAYTTPTTPIKLALSTATTSDTSAGTEVSGGSYVRQSITFGTASAANPSVISNSAAVNFTSMPAATVTDVNVYDSAGTPVREAWGALTASKTTSSGDTLSFAIGALTISL